MQNIWNNERGAAMIAGLLFLVVLSVLGTTAYMTSSNDLTICQNYKSSKQSFYMAEAGVQYALGEIENGLSAGTFTMPSSTGSSVSLSGFGIPSGFSFTLSNMTMASSNSYALTSTGTSPSNSVSVVEVYFKRKSALNYAAFGDVEFDGKNSASVYSYDHTDSGNQPGDPGFTSTGEGDIGSNGEVILHNGMMVDGDVALGADETDPTDTADITEMGGGGVVTGDKGVEVGWVDPDPLNVAGTAFSSDFTTYSSSNDNVSLAGIGTSINNPSSAVNLVGQSGGANYYFTEISLGNSDVINIDASAGTVNVYLEGNMVLDNAAELNITGTSESNTVNIYVQEPSGGYSGDIINFKNGSVINISGNPTEFSIISSSDAGVRFHNSSAFKGTVYAPYAEVEMNNSSSVYGAIWGSNVLMHNGGDLYFDTALKDKYQSNELELTSWRPVHN